MAAHPPALAQPRRTPRPTSRRFDPVASLAGLAQLAMTPGAASVETVIRACELLRIALGAEETYVVRAGDPHFVRVDTAGDPTAYELKQKGYYIVWRELANRPQLMGGLFQVADRRITDAGELEAGVAATHLALLLPSDESTSELLIVRGPWPAGLTRKQVEFVTAARPMLACLVGTLLDTQRRDRQREQLESLSAVAAAVTHGQELDTALPAICTALAKASGFDWATLSLVNESLDQITSRAMNNARYAETETAAISMEGAVLRERTIASARHIARTRRPLLYPRIDMPEHERLFEVEMQRYFERSHILSLATFPLWSGERLIGTLSFSTSSAHNFEPAEVAFLTLLCEQAVLAIEWLRLHRELRDANAALDRAATHDALTGLPNRALFLDRLDQNLARAVRTDGLAAVLFADLDDFKAVNDSLGHDAGDRLLQIVAERLQRTLRTGDTVARMGGDEFTVVLGDVPDEATAAQVAARLQEAVQQPTELAGRQLLPRVSIGLACGPAEHLSAEGLLRKADLAMYRAKLRSKACAAAGGDGSGRASRERYPAIWSQNQIA